MTVTRPRGFRAAGVAAGLKSTGAQDVALVVNDGPRYDAAGVFTANRCQANPVLWSKEVVKDGVVRAVVLNSGGANCYTSPDGFLTTHAVAERVAEHLGTGAIDVVVCSTGLIGLANDRQQVLAGVDAAYDALGTDGGPEAAAAIMTTDTVAKQVVVDAAGWSGGACAHLAPRPGPQEGGGRPGRRSGGGIAQGRGIAPPPLPPDLGRPPPRPGPPPRRPRPALAARAPRRFDRLDSDGCMS